MLSDELVWIRRLGNQQRKKIAALVGSGETNIAGKILTNIRKESALWQM
jgi:hypothetical protein